MPWGTLDMCIDNCCIHLKADPPGNKDQDYFRRYFLILK